MQRDTRTMRPAVIISAALTGVAFVVSLLASLNLYLLEDQNPLTLAAYRSAPLLRVSYDAAYISALVAGIMVVALLARLFAPTGWSALAVTAALAVVVAFGGFGGLLVRAPLSFLTLFAGFCALTLLCLFIAERTAASLRRTSSDHTAALMGSCAGVVVALLVNAAALAPHTVFLNPVSHALYMQGQLPGAHLNALLLGAALQLLLVAALGLSLLVALLLSRRASA